MRRCIAIAALCSLVLVSCSKKEEPPVQADPPKLPVKTQQAQPQQPDDPKEPHFANVTQLTDEGDNGEAYFSWDSSRLIWQSNRGGEACDKIWTMNLDGSDKTMVSPPGGAHTCSYFLPGDSAVVFASTSHLGAECPPRPQVPGQHYVWPLWPYDIFKTTPGKTPPDGLVNLTADNPAYDAEPIVTADGSKIVFGSKREGDFDIYSMNADGTDQTRLTDDGAADGSPSAR